MAGGYKYFERIEKHAGLLGVGIAVMVSIGGLAEVTPLFMRAHAVQPPAHVQPYDPLRLIGKDIYVRDGCYLCHTQMIRAQRFEVQRYGAYTTAEESFYDRPHQWGSKRTGPDLSRVGGKYSDQWHRLHLLDPRQVVPESNMPAYQWLADARLDAADVQARMRTLRFLGDPYTDEQIAAVPKALEGKTEMDALIAYLQGLGTSRAPAGAGKPDATDTSRATGAPDDATAAGKATATGASNGSAQ